VSCAVGTVLWLVFVADRCQLVSLRPLNGGFGVRRLPVSCTADLPAAWKPDILNKLRIIMFRRLST
jgi:hypothetical protein